MLEDPKGGYFITDRRRYTMGTINENSILPITFIILLFVVTTVCDKDGVYVIKEPSYGESAFFFAGAFCMCILTTGIVVGIHRCITIFDKRTKKLVEIVGTFSASFTTFLHTAGGQFMAAYIKYQKMHLLLGFFQLGVSLFTGCLSMFTTVYGRAFTPRYHPVPQGPPVFEGKKKQVDFVHIFTELAGVTVSLVAVFSFITYAMTGNAPYWATELTKRLKDSQHIKSLADSANKGWAYVLRWFRPCDVFCQCQLCKEEFESLQEAILGWEIDYLISSGADTSKLPNLTPRNARWTQYYHAIHHLYHKTREEPTCTEGTMESCDFHESFLQFYLKHFKSEVGDDDDLSGLVHKSFCGEICVNFFACPHLILPYWKFAHKENMYLCPTCKTPTHREGKCAKCLRQGNVCLKCREAATIGDALFCKACNRKVVPPIPKVCGLCKFEQCICKGKCRQHDKTILKCDLCDPYIPEGEVDKKTGSLLLQSEIDANFPKEHKRHYTEAGQPCAMGEWRCCDDTIRSVLDTDFRTEHYNSCVDPYCEIWLQPSERNARRQYDKMLWSTKKIKVNHFSPTITTPSKEATIRVEVNRARRARSDTAIGQIFPNANAAANDKSTDIPHQGLPLRFPSFRDLYDHYYSVIRDWWEVKWEWFGTKAEKVIDEVCDHPYLTGSALTIVTMLLMFGAYHTSKSNYPPTVNKDIFSPMTESLVFEGVKRLVMVNGNAYNVYAPHYTVDTIAAPGGGHMKVSSDAFNHYVDSVFARSGAKVMELPTTKGVVKIVKVTNVSAEGRVKCSCGRRNLVGRDCVCKKQSYSVKNKVIAKAMNNSKRFEAILPSSDIFVHYDRIVPRVFVVHLRKENGTLFTINNGFLWGSYLLTTKHAFDNFVGSNDRDGVKITSKVVFSSLNNTFESDYSTHRSTKHPDLIYFHVNVPSRLDPVNLASPTYGQQVMLVSHRRIDGYKKVSPSTGRVTAFDKENNLSCYDASSDWGDCGSPVITSNNCVVGIHAAGQKQVTNFFIPFTPEIIDDLKQNF